MPAYGYGNVYRPPPAIAQQQVRPPKARIGNDPVPYPLPFGLVLSPRSRSVFAQRAPLMRIGEAPVAFPKLGAWWPGLMDPPSSGTQTRQQRRPAVVEIILVGVPYPTPAAWMAVHGSAFRREWPLLALEQRPPLLPVGSEAVPFPLPIGLVLLPLARGVYYQRLPVLPPPIIIAGIPYRTPATWMALHGAAYVRDWPIPLLEQRPRLLPVGAEPVPFPLPFGLVLSSLARSVYHQRLPITPEVLVLGVVPFPTPPQWMSRHRPAFERDWSIPLLTQQLALLGVGDPPISFPKLGSWPSGIMDPPHTRSMTAQVHPPLVAIGGDPVPFPLPLGLVLTAQSRAPYYQRRPIVIPVLVIEGVAFPMPWALAALHGAAYRRDWSAIPLEQQRALLGIAGEAIAFPFLGEWLPGTMDAPRTLEQQQVRPPKLPVSGSAIAFPKLGLWQPGSMDPPRVVEQLQVHPPLIGVGDPPVPFPLPFALVLRPLPRQVYHQRRPQLAELIVLDALRVVDLSGSRYVLEDHSGGRYLLEDLGGGRYRLTDASGQRYDVVNYSLSRYPTEDRT